MLSLRSSDRIAAPWGDDFRAGTLADTEILAGLFALNQERANSEHQRGLL